MTKEEYIKFWLVSSQNDLESALDIFHSKRYNWALFIGHLALEKLMKALYIEITHDLFPLKTHNLLKLLKLIGLDATQSQLEFFADVNRFNISTRYPDYKEDFSKIATEEFTRHYINGIQEQYQWLKSRMK
jgi:HEPN domain-containing protein